MVSQQRRMKGGEGMFLLLTEETKYTSIILNRNFSKCDGTSVIQV
jgi:hypothetical protein